MIYVVLVHRQKQYLKVKLWQCLVDHQQKTKGLAQTYE